MSIYISILAAFVGYIIGSISFVRIFAWYKQPKTDIEKIEVAIPGSAEPFRSDSVSATAARLHMGTCIGCLTGMLDMLKVALPTLIFLLIYQDQPYHLIVASTGLVGHDWPLYHRFKGGRGESPIYGALLVISPLGVLATTATGAFLGLVVGHILIFRWAGLVLMIPWLWFTTQSWPHLAYIVFANLIYWTTMAPELAQYYRLIKITSDITQEVIAGEFGMDARLGKTMDRYSILGYIHRIKSK